MQKLLEIELKADDADCAQPKKGTLTQRRWCTPSSRIERARRSSSRTSSNCPARRSCCNVSIGQKEMTREVKQMSGYSCALMSDILLQGHLYVTENYIAFHSNVFGYVTRVIDPSSSLSLNLLVRWVHFTCLKGKQQTFIFSDPDPDDLNQLVHKGENGEDHSKCDRCDHP